MMTDIPGIAIKDFFEKRKKHRLYVHDQFGPRVEMPVSLYFRDWQHMPRLEQVAIGLCKGKILDIGAGAGSHALELQTRKQEVTALEISPAACEVMVARNVQNVCCADVFQFLPAENFDTLLLLMNGIGLCGSVDGLATFLEKAKSLLNPGGHLIFDSSDIAYMYEEEEKPPRYYGEVTCRYEYNKVLTDWFQWLYIDAATLTRLAESRGWKVTIAGQDDNDQYLAVLRQG